ncbi:anti-sigma factor antagonist [Micromonospora globbae]|uniref:Anti-sigma factor antagonist n=1 Tax=Micromonospora globbae TaxID=1894969 RepID=A0A420F712_9ACTN|nr:STAS domain-containing protein [Micromonospora globbae]RKF28701.1 STAS domain-containing protein [Micromonospora globbae]
MGERSDRFHVRVSVGDHGVDVHAVGEIDIATVGALRSALWAAPARPVLRLHLSGVRLLSAAGVRALVAAHRRVRTRGGELVLVDPEPVVARVLRVTGLHRVIPVVETSGPASASPATTPRPTAAVATAQPTVAVAAPQPTAAVAAAQPTVAAPAPQPSVAVAAAQPSSGGPDRSAPARPEPPQPVLLAA